MHWQSTVIHTILVYCTLIHILSLYNTVQYYTSDVQVCESLEKLDRLANASSKVVAEEYLKNDVPFIVTDAMDDWPVMNTNEFWFDNITEVSVGAYLACPHFWSQFF